MHVLYEKSKEINEPGPFQLEGKERKKVGYQKELIRMS